MEKHTRETIQSAIITFTSEMLGVSRDEIRPESHFVEDLGADSLDTVELLICAEDEFGREISDEEAEPVKTVADAVNLICRLEGVQ